MKKIRYIFEAILVYSFYYIFKLLPIDLSSWLMGKILRVFGALQAASKTAFSNLNYVNFPGDHKEIVKDMWENLGKTVGEFPHLPTLDLDFINKRTEVVGIEIIENEKNFILCSGHFANWEWGPRILFLQNKAIAGVYRHSNNSYVEKLVTKTRAKIFSKMFAKGRKSVRQMLNHLKEKQSIGMLVDQKNNRGIELNFLGKKAMTAPAIAELAREFNMPITPVQVIRKKGVNFKIIIHQKIMVENLTNAQALQQINDHFSNWVLQNPSQWFWLHKRWGKKL